VAAQDGLKRIQANAVHTRHGLPRAYARPLAIPGSRPSASIRPALHRAI
jgi:hypothetical protein